MHNHNKGFTLLEVLIVVIIIGILAAIALPQYTTTIEKAKSAEALSQLGTLRSSMDRYWIEHTGLGIYTAGTVDFGTAFTEDIKLDIDNPNKNTGSLYVYSLVDLSTLTTQAYTLRAEKRTKPLDYWIQMKVTRSADGVTSATTTKSARLGG